MEALVTDLLDGTYRVEYVAPSAGTYQLAVWLEEGHQGGGGGAPKLLHKGAVEAAPPPPPAEADVEALVM